MTLLQDQGSEEEGYSEEEDAYATAEDDRALIEPNFKVAPYEQDDSNDEEQESSDNKGAPGKITMFHLSTKVKASAMMTRITMPLMIPMMQVSAMMIAKKKTTRLVKKSTAYVSASLWKM